MTTPFWVSDIPALFADFGLTLTTASGATTKAILDDEETAVDDGVGTVLRRERVLWIKTGSVAVARQDVVTYHGTSYTVREVRVDGDGALTKLVLA